MRRLLAFVLVVLTVLASVSSVQVITGFDYQKIDVPLSDSPSDSSANNSSVSQSDQQKKQLTRQDNSIQKVAILNSSVTTTSGVNSTNTINSVNASNIANSTSSDDSTKKNSLNSTSSTNSTSSDDNNKNSVNSTKSDDASKNSVNSTNSTNSTSSDDNKKKISIKAVNSTNSTNSTNSDDNKKNNYTSSTNTSSTNTSSTNTNSTNTNSTNSGDDSKNNLTNSTTNKSEDSLFYPNPQIQQQISPYSNSQYYESGRQIGIVSLLNDDPKDQGKQIASIIVTFANGESYDELFQRVPQKSKEGTRVLVYQGNPYELDKIQKALQDARYDENFQNRNTLDLMVNRILGLSKKCSQCIVFNWECSSSYGDKKFPQGESKVYKFVSFIIGRGHFAMFSDFSLKALINTWEQKYLGPNPFKQVGETHSTTTLSFDRDVLAKSPSTQLRTIAELAEKEEVLVRVLGGTIVYQVNQKRKKTDKYQLQVLTTALGNDRQIFPAAGHTLLKYKSGGYLLTSMVHWIELMKIDTTSDRLFSAATNLYGSSYAKNLQATYNSLPTEYEKNQYLQTNSLKIVQDQSPAFNANLLP